MSKLRICTGELASEPFFLPQACINIYSIEELCYLLALNPFIITNDLIDERLVDWIEEQCMLPDLSAKLRPLFRKGSQIGDFVNLIMDYVNFCDQNERDVINDTLRNNSGLNDLERKKRQADYLLKNGKYEAAIDEYESLLSKLPEVDQSLRPAVYQNMGYTYAKLFMFDIAAKYYKRAYEMTGNIEIGTMYLSATRLFLSDEKYLRLMSEHGELHEASLALEKKIKSVLGDFEGSRESIMLNVLNMYKDDGNIASYYEEIDKVIADMKADYLKQVIN